MLYREGERTPIRDILTVVFFLFICWDITGGKRKRRDETPFGIGYSGNRICGLGPGGQSVATC